MNDIQIIEEFERSWEYTRRMTTSFIECVPEQKWEFTHHPKFAPLYIQFRHMVKVYGCYVDALRTKHLDMGKKGSFYAGNGDRKTIQESLADIDRILKDELAELKKSGLGGLVVDVFGTKMGFTEFSHVMIQHEASHFGIWANYAAFGEFPTPSMWQCDWLL